MRAHLAQDPHIDHLERPVQLPIPPHSIILSIHIHEIAATARLPDEAAAVLDARAAALRLGLPRRLNAPTRQTVMLLLNSTSGLVGTYSPGPRPKVIPSQEDSVSRVCGCRIVRPDQAKGKPRGKLVALSRKRMRLGGCSPGVRRASAASWRAAAPRG